eukprot:569397-Prymnesium_polylepis.1
MGHAPVVSDTTCFTSSAGPGIDVRGRQPKAGTDGSRTATPQQVPQVLLPESQQLTRKYHSERVRGKRQCMLRQPPERGSRSSAVPTGRTTGRKSGIVQQCVLLPFRWPPPENPRASPFPTLCGMQEGRGLAALRPAPPCPAFWARSVPSSLGCPCRSFPLSQARHLTVGSRLA